MFYLFDVDGTLTPSRGVMDPEFRVWFMKNVAHKAVLVTGSDPDKTIEQVGEELFRAVKSYNCAGNHVFDKGVEVRRSDWKVPDDLYADLEMRLVRSKYARRTGKHIEERVGLCNFSVVGRNATPDERAHYRDWDSKYRERQRISEEIEREWPDIRAAVAGETGIDIYPRGMGKEQVLQDFIGEFPVHFFGDKLEPGGNDHEIAEEIKKYNLGECYDVRDWRETWQILQRLVTRNP